MPGTGSRQGNDRGARAGRSVIVVFDLDRTITRVATYTPFLLFVARRRPLRLLLAGPLLIAALAYKLGLISRKRLKEHMLCAVLCGAGRDQVAEFAAAFTARWATKRVRPGALTAIEKHRSKDHHLILATASLDLYVERFGAQFGFDDIVATRASWDSTGCLSGRIDGENCFGTEKVRRLEQVLAGGREDSTVVAYSDSHADLPLLRWADRAVAVNPSRRLRSAALGEGFEIVDWDRVW